VTSLLHACALTVYKCIYVHSCVCVLVFMCVCLCVCIHVCF
jgi:hypothetical protein